MGRDASGPRMGFALAEHQNAIRRRGARPRLLAAVRRVTASAHAGVEEEDSRPFPGLEPGLGLDL